jgi:hypothetical protein
MAQLGCDTHVSAGALIYYAQQGTEKARYRLETQWHSAKVHSYGKAKLRQKSIATEKQSNAWDVDSIEIKGGAKK